MGKRRTPPGQLPLDDAQPRRSQGPAERAVAADLKAMRESGELGAGRKGLEAAYREAARLVDRARLDPEGGWLLAKALSELRAARRDLGPIGSNDDDMERLMNDVRAALRNTTPT